eukprot:7590968-Pyramimonas_sp.AAC.1
MGYPTALAAGTAVAALRLPAHRFGINCFRIIHIASPWEGPYYCRLAHSLLASYRLAGSLHYRMAYSWIWFQSGSRRDSIGAPTVGTKTRDAIGILARL